MRGAMGCPALPIVLGELGYFLDVADPRFVHAAAVNAGMVRLAAGDVASNPTPTPTPTPSPSPSPSLRGGQVALGGVLLFEVAQVLGEQLEPG